MPKPFLSSLVEGCLESAKDVTQGGGYYTWGPGLVWVGLADYADSMTAVRQLVFGTKALTMAQLVVATTASFGRRPAQRLGIGTPKLASKPSKMLPRVLARFVRAQCDARAAGWLDAACVALDLGMAGSAFVDVKAGEVVSRARRSRAACMLVCGAYALSPKTRPRVAAAMPTRRRPMAQHGQAQGNTATLQNLGLCSTIAHG